MKILGITPGHDAAAAVIEDGRIIANVAEERFTRVKHSADAPINAIQYCMEEAGVSNINEFDLIAIAGNFFGEDIKVLLGLDKNDKSIKRRVRAYGKRRLLGTTSKMQLPVYFPDLKVNDPKKVKTLDHHLAHAASAYYSTKDSKETLIFTADGIGDQKCTAIWIGKGNKIRMLKSWGKEGGLGWAYSLVTEGLHYIHGDGEGTVMGLACYGDPEKCRGVLDKYFPMFKDGELIKPAQFTNPAFWESQGSYQYHIKEATAIEKLAEKYGPENIAAEAQRLLEENIMDIVFSWIKKTGIKKTAYSGGVFLNVKVNQRIWQNRKDLITEQIIFPDAGDSGLAVGSALYFNYKESEFEGNAIEHLYFGPAYNENYIKGLLIDQGLKFEKKDKPEKHVAKLLAENKIVAWFQGKMESGPRALGNRSILMSPLKAENKDIINARVKFRESFRPFCPSIIYEKRDEYLIDARDEFFMITSFDVTREKRDKIPAVVHVDGTLRPQLVKKSINEKYWKIISEFGKLTGEYCILNTSFNIKGEPVINHPKEAIAGFYNNGIDYLILGNFIISKDG